MLAVLIIVGAVVVLWGIQTVIDSAISGADRAVRRKTYDAGRREVLSTTTFTAPIASDELLEKIVTTVNAHASAPAVVGGLYLKARDTNSATFATGSKAGGDAFRAQVSVTRGDDGSRGTFEVLNWSESGAEVAGRSDAAKIRSRIETVVLGCGGSIQTT